MISSGIAALLRYGPWAVPAALAISLGVMTAFWYSRGRALDASEKLVKIQAESITSLTAGLAEADARFEAERGFRDSLTGYLQELRDKQNRIAKDVANALKDEPTRADCALRPVTTERLRARWADRTSALKGTMPNPR